MKNCLGHSVVEVAWVVLVLAACGNGSTGDDPSAAGGGENAGAAGSAANDASGGSSANGGASGTHAGGGTAGSAAQTASGGSAGTASACAAGTATFAVRYASEADTTSLCVAGCGLDVTFLTLSGTRMSPYQNCTTAYCASCQAFACPGIYCEPFPLRSEGEALTWDGSHWTLDTCGEATTCQRGVCVEPGRYVIRVCVPRSNGTTEYSCEPSGEPPVCSEVEFDLPSSEPTIVELAP
jgi:hypothetical protein